MKILKYSLLLSLVIFATPSNILANDSKFGANALYGTLLVGSTGSFLFWLPQTLRTIERYGVSGAIATTHIPRTAIDILTIAAAYYGLYQTNKIKETCSCKLNALRELARTK